MIENYKGWDITLTWDDKHSFGHKSSINDTFNQKEKWKGVNLMVIEFMEHPLRR